MNQSRSQVVFQDVAGARVHFSAEQIAALIASLSAEQRRYSKLCALTVQEPQEIWQEWVTDEEGGGRWKNVRSYLSSYDLSALNEVRSFVFVIVQFEYRSRWEISSLEVRLGDQMDILAEVGKNFRVGELVYSAPIAGMPAQPGGGD